MTGVLSAVIGLILASAFSAILVYAQELVPGHVGLDLAGLFFGLAFGIGGLGAAALGVLADATSIAFVYRVCAWLPALGLLTAWLPDLEPRRGGRDAACHDSATETQRPQRHRCEDRPAAAGGRACV